MPNSKPLSVVVVGAGPAGLTAAYFLSKAGCQVDIIEADHKYVGGISKTVEFGGYYFDIGGHRFFSKSKEVENFWNELLPDDLLVRSRKSRIFYRKTYFSYPLKPLEAFRKLGFRETVLCLASYLRATLFPKANPASIADWVSNQFGARLFEIFFRTYTEKVWGISCKHLSADWAAQRIRGVSPASMLIHALRLGRKRKHAVKSLIESFRYPRRGPGMMWEACAKKIVEMGGRLHMGQRASSFRYCAQEKRWKTECVGRSGAALTFESDHVISSAAISDIASLIFPPLSSPGILAAQSLKYREFIMVCLVLKGEEMFSDNWLYIHDPSVKMGRIQNFKSWSPEMLADSALQSVGVEYFCTEGDQFWQQTDQDLKELAISELKEIGLWNSHEVVRAEIVRQKKAYPIYDEQYLERVSVIRAELDQKFPSFHLVGRNGMHRYNNQDHAVMTAMLTVKNILAEKKIYDVWLVNQDAEYHEELREAH